MEAVPGLAAFPVPPCPLLEQVQEQLTSISQSSGSWDFRRPHVQGPGGGGSRDRKALGRTDATSVLDSALSEPVPPALRHCAVGC